MKTYVKTREIEMESINEERWARSIAFTKECDVLQGLRVVENNRREDDERRVILKVRLCLKRLKF